jgi:hypothetical protein
MIIVIGDINDKNYERAKAHLIDTEKKHQIYGTADIVTLPEIAELLPLE